MWLPFFGGSSLDMVYGNGVYIICQCLVPGPSVVKLYLPLLSHMDKLYQVLPLLSVESLGMKLNIDVFTFTM